MKHRLSDLCCAETRRRARQSRTAGYLRVRFAVIALLDSDAAGATPTHTRAAFDSTYRSSPQGRWASRLVFPTTDHSAHRHKRDSRQRSATSRRDELGEVGERVVEVAWRERREVEVLTD